MFVNVEDVLQPDALGCWAGGEWRAEVLEHLSQTRPHSRKHATGKTRGRVSTVGLRYEVESMSISSK